MSENNTSKPKDASEIDWSNVTIEAPPIPKIKSTGKGKRRERRNSDSEEEEDSKPRIPLAKTQALTHHEGGGFFDQLANKKGYMQGWDSIASSYYEGDPLGRDTITHGEQATENPSMNMLIAGTETIPESYNPQSFKQGLYNKANHIYARTCEERGVPEKPQSENEAPESTLNIGYAIKVFKALWNFPPTKLVFGVHADKSKDAKKLLNEYKNRKLDEADAEYERSPTTKAQLRVGYYGNLENDIQRISGNFAVARYFSDPDNIEHLKKQPYLVICYEDVQQAISFYDRVVLRGLEKVLTLMSNAERKHTQLESYEKIFSEIRDKLRGSTVEGQLQTFKCAMTYQKLYEQMPSNYKKFAEYIDSAGEAGIVQVINGVALKMGAPSRVVQLKTQFDIENAPKPIQEQTPEEKKAIEELLAQFNVPQTLDEAKQTLCEGEGAEQ